MHEVLGPFNKCWHPGRRKWQPEDYIFFLSVLWLDKFVQQELKQRHSESLWWDGSVPSTETSNFRLLFMTSWASVFLLLKLAVTIRLTLFFFLQFAFVRINVYLSECAYKFILSVFPWRCLPAEFLTFFGLLNFYLYTMAFVYSPSKNALYGKHVGLDVLLTTA